MIDIVNFNGDASCLKRARYLHAIREGEIAQWLGYYEASSRHVSVGMCGVSLIDLFIHKDSASLDLLRSSSYIHTIYRPFVHALSTVMDPSLSCINILLGILVTRTILARTSNYFLPPEFLFRMSDVLTLRKCGVEYTFDISPDTLNHANELLPYSIIRCLVHPSGASIKSINMHQCSTKAYLRCIQIMSEYCGTDNLWRDGESFLFLPDGLKREEMFINQTRHVKSIVSYVQEMSSAELQLELDYYPLRPLSPWIGDHANHWYRQIGNRLLEWIYDDKPITLFMLVLLLMMYSSDLRASASKDDVSFDILPLGGHARLHKFGLKREVRTGYAEALEWLADISIEVFPNDISDSLVNSMNGSANKLTSRIRSYVNLIVDSYPVFRHANTLGAFKKILEDNCSVQLDY